MGMYKNTYIGSNIQRIRKGKHVNQWQVAQKLGWYTCKLSTIETGNLIPTYIDILQLAEYFGMEPKFIIGDDCIGNYE